MPQEMKLSGGKLSASSKVAIPGRKGQRNYLSFTDLHLPTHVQPEMLLLNAMSFKGSKK